MNLRSCHLALPALVSFAFVASLACNRSQPQPVAPVVAAAAPTRKVTKIVFVGKEHACDCTRKSVDAGWAALQNALGTPSRIPTERIQVDTEAAKVEPYRAQRAIMALPAIYFVGEQDAVLAMLQGEVTEAQIRPILGTPSEEHKP